jgi:hypothetical protein
MRLVPVSGGTHQAWAHAWETIRCALGSARSAKASP